MVLHLVGLGLHDEYDVTVRGRQVIQDADFVYIESYTAILAITKERLEKFYGKTISEADRTTVESDCEEILQRAEGSKVAFLVVGDPLCATTHTDLYLRAVERGITVRVIHNASIMNAVAACGLQLYRFGESISIPYFDAPAMPNSYFSRVLRNRSSGLHTLCLLDIQVKEQKVENIMKGNNVFEEPRFMSIAEAINQLFVIEEHLEETTAHCSHIRGIGIARLGGADEVIRSGTLQELADFDFGGPLHSLVICAPDLHEVETNFYDLFHVNRNAKKADVNSETVS